MSRGARIGLLAAAVVILIVAFIALRPSGQGRRDDGGLADDDPDGGRDGHPRRRDRTATAPPTPRPTVDPGPVLTGASVESCATTRATPCASRSRAPEDEEVHIHGYDIKKDVEAGVTTKISFKATIDGIFEIEFEDAAKQIAALASMPRARVDRLQGGDLVRDLSRGVRSSVSGRATVARRSPSISARAGGSDAARIVGPSTNSGMSASGTPAASAASVEPEPPWPTIAVARAIAACWSTQRLTCTFAGSAPRSAGSRRAERHQQRRAVGERLDRVAVERGKCDVAAPRSRRRRRRGRRLAGGERRGTEAAQPAVSRCRARAGPGQDGRGGEGGGVAQTESASAGSAMASRPRRCRSCEAGARRSGRSARRSARRRPRTRTRTSRARSGPVDSSAARSIPAARPRVEATNSSWMTCTMPGAAPGVKTGAQCLARSGASPTRAIIAARRARPAPARAGAAKVTNVAGALVGVRERHHRGDVPAAAAAREQDAHASVQTPAGGGLFRRSGAERSGL